MPKSIESQERSGVIVETQAEQRNNEIGFDLQILTPLPQTFGSAYQSIEEPSEAPASGGFFVSPAITKAHHSALQSITEQSGESKEHQEPFCPPGARLLRLTQGKFALVDAEDYERCAAFKWQYHPEPNGRTAYAQRNTRRPDGVRTKDSLHRLIMGSIPGDGLRYDHRNGNGLDCRRSNLRLATALENSRNIPKPRHGRSSRYKGVSWNPTVAAWQANIRLNGKSIYLGVHPTQEIAALHYNAAALKYFGEFARPNAVLPIPSQESAR